MTLEEMTNKVHCADCLEFMKQIPDKSIDLALTDPPFGIGFMYEEKEKTNTAKEYGKFIKPYFEEMKRISKKYVAMAQATKYMQYFWDWYGEDIRIYIGCKNFVSLRKTFMNYAYDPWVFYFHDNIELRTKKKPHRNLDWVKCDTAGLRNTYNLERKHPTPKPVSMLAEMIENFTNPNDLILDPFLGSGTTAVAAQKLGRRWIGIEISEKYCQIARERLSQKPLGI
ncbi:MAG: site-specific DNA-methyltransferase [Patescibacteria group bacterium]